MANLLSIDWDFVTGDCSGGSSGSCGYCLSKYGKKCSLPSKRTRRRGGLKYRIPLWNERFKMLVSLPRLDNPLIYVAESHASLGDLLQNVKKFYVYDFDSHVDSGHYDDLNCGSWIRFMGESEWVYSSYDGTLKECEGSCRVMSLKEALKRRFSVVFICKSSPWTPSSMDLFFHKLIHLITKKSGGHLRFIGHHLRELIDQHFRMRSQF